MAILDYQVFKPYAAGNYQAKCAAIADGPNGEYGPSLEFKFLLLGEEDENGNEVYVSGLASKTFSSRSKLGQWAAALLGVESFDTGYRLDTDELIGRKCELTLTIEPNAKGEKVNKIKALVPARAKKKGTDPSDPESF